MARHISAGVGTEADVYDSRAYIVTPIELANNHVINRQHNLDNAFRWFMNITTVKHQSFDVNRERQYVAMYYRNVDEFISIIPNVDENTKVEYTQYMMSTGLQQLIGKYPSIMDRKEQYTLPNGKIIHHELFLPNTNNIYCVFDGLTSFVKNSATNILTRLKNVQFKNNDCPENFTTLLNLVDKLVNNMSNANLIESLSSLNIGLDINDIDPFACLYDVTPAPFLSESLDKYRNEAIKYYMSNLGIVSEEDLNSLDKDDFKQLLKDMKQFTNFDNGEMTNIIPVDELKTIFSTDYGAHSYMSSEILRRMMQFIVYRHGQDKFFFENVFEVFNKEINRLDDLNIKHPLLDLDVLHSSVIMSYLCYIKLANQINEKDKQNVKSCDCEEDGEDGDESDNPNFEEGDIDSSITDPVDFSDVFDPDTVKSKCRSIKGNSEVENTELGIVEFQSNDTLRKYSLYQDPKVKNTDPVKSKIYKRKMYKMLPSNGGIIPKYKPPKEKKYYNTILIDTSGSCFHMLEAFISDVFNDSCISEVYTYNTCLNKPAENNIITNKDDFKKLIKNFQPRSGGTSLNESMIELHDLAKKENNTSLFKKTLFVFTDGWDSAVNLENYRYKRIVVYYTDEPIIFENNPGTEIISIKYNKETRNS